MHGGPESEDVVIRRLLLRNADQFPDQNYAMFEDGVVWTWSDTLAMACGTAHVLRQAGVKQGDRVAIMLPNGADYLRACWGAAMLGAVLVPINIAYRGGILAHLLRLANPHALVADGDFLDRFAPFEASMTNVIRLAPEALRASDDTVPNIGRPIEYWDVHALMMTSGTTGPSKLSATTYRHIYLGGRHYLGELGRGPEDTFLADLPLFHLGAMYQVATTVHTRTRIAVRARPDFRNYWDVVRATGATAGLLLSTMVPYLLNQPERDSDRQHGMRLMLAAPLPRDIQTFQYRFGIDCVRTALGSTEVPGPLVGDARDAVAHGYCGRTRAGFQVRLVDQHDVEVAVGEPGEMVVRPDFPWSVSAGYVGDDEATAHAWRNGWFHSGDTLRRDEEGRFFFVDRVKDAVRRRGENISTAEVEAELAKHPDVAEAACVPFRAPDWVDDELKAWIIPVPGATIDFETLLRFSAEHLPHFMVPRYFELAADFPRTASTRVQKFVLRERGNSAATWDRATHGLEVTRNGVRTKAPVGQTG